MFNTSLYFLIMQEITKSSIAIREPNHCYERNSVGLSGGTLWDAAQYCGDSWRRRYQQHQCAAAAATQCSNVAMQRPRRAAPTTAAALVNIVKAVDNVVYEEGPSRRIIRRPVFNTEYLPLAGRRPDDGSGGTTPAPSPPPCLPVQRSQFRLEDSSHQFLPSGPLLRIPSD